MQAVPDSLARARDAYLAMLAQSPANIVKIPLASLTGELAQELCLKAVQLAGAALALLPDALVTREMCLCAVSGNGLALRHVPRKLVDRDMCLAAVRANGLALRFVPSRLCDWDMARAAVENDGQALGLVPLRLREQEICHLGAARGASLAMIPERFRDRIVWQGLVRSGRASLGDVPHPLRDKSLCLDALRLEGTAIKDVPGSILDQGMCALAVRTSGSALIFVPDAWKTRDMCIQAVQNFPWAYRHVPDRFRRDREICSAAVHGHGSLIRDVPGDARDEIVRRAALTAQQGSSDAAAFLDAEARAARASLAKRQESPQRARAQGARVLPAQAQGLFSTQSCPAASSPSWFS